jgi:hypothetical protein
MNGTLKRALAYKLAATLVLLLAASGLTVQAAAPVVCGGIQGKVCPAGQFCDLPAGQCKGADLQGVCVPKPEACTDIYKPVCGCDAKTYGNDCERIRAGVQKDYEGECKKPM